MKKTHIQYIGPADIRLLGVEDVGAELEFRHNEPTEVDPKIAKAILEHDGLVGEFEETSAPVAPDAHDDSIDQGEALPSL